MHWSQDCLNWLRGFCLRSDCIRRDCQEHCVDCGLESLIGPTDFLKPKHKYEVGEGTMPVLNEILAYRHKETHQFWKRIPTVNVSGDKPWIISGIAFYAV